MTSKAQSVTEKIDKSDFIKTKNCSLRGPIKRMKRQVTEREKIFADDIYNQGYPG